MISNVLQYIPLKQDDNNNIKSFQNLNASFKIPLKVSFGLGKYSVTPNFWQQKLWSKISISLFFLHLLINQKWTRICSFLKTKVQNLQRAVNSLWGLLHSGLFSGFNGAPLGEVEIGPWRLVKVCIIWPGHLSYKRKWTKVCLVDESRGGWVTYHTNPTRF